MKRLHYKGSEKSIYLTDDDERIILEMRDDVLKDKSFSARDLAAVSMNLFEYLESYNIHTHYVSKYDHASFEVKRMTMIPVVFILRNELSRAVKNRYSRANREHPEPPFIECKIAGKNEYISEEDLIKNNILTQDHYKKICRVIIKSNVLLKTFFLRRGFELLEFKSEFGKFKNRLLLGDAFGHDSIVLRKMKDGQGNLSEEQQSIFNFLAGE